MLVEETCKFYEDFVKRYKDGNDEWDFLEVDVQYPEVRF